MKIINHRYYSVVLKVILIVSALLAVCAFSCYIFVGHIDNKVISGKIVGIDYLDKGDIVYFEKGETISASNKLPIKISIEPNYEYAVTFKEVSGGVFVRHSIYLDKIYKVSEVCNDKR